MSVVAYHGLIVIMERAPFETQGVRVGYRRTLARGNETLSPDALQVPLAPDRASPSRPVASAGPPMVCDPEATGRPHPRASPCKGHTMS